MKSLIPFDIISRSKRDAIPKRGKPARPFWLNASVWASFVCLFLLIACGPSPIQTPAKKASDNMNKTSAPYNQGSAPQPKQTQQQQPCKADGETCTSNDECCSRSCFANTCITPTP